MTNPQYEREMMRLARATAIEKAYEAYMRAMSEPDALWDDLPERHPFRHAFTMAGNAAFDEATYQIMALAEQHSAEFLPTNNRVVNHLLVEGDMGDYYSIGDKVAEWIKELRNAG